MRAGNKRSRPRTRRIKRLEVNRVVTTAISENQPLLVADIIIRYCVTTKARLLAEGNDACPRERSNQLWELCSI